MLNIKLEKNSEHISFFEKVDIEERIAVGRDGMRKYLQKAILVSKELGWIDDFNQERPVNGKSEWYARFLLGEEEADIFQTSSTLW